jgi:hypothetical protein
MQISPAMLPLVSKLRRNLPQTVRQKLFPVICLMKAQAGQAAALPAVQRNLAMGMLPRLFPDLDGAQLALLTAYLSLACNQDGFYSNFQMPQAGNAGATYYNVDLSNGAPLNSIAQLQSVQQDLQSLLDSMNEMSEMTSMRLQMSMDRRSKFVETLSNVLKGIDDTSEAIVQNMK